MASKQMASIKKVVLYKPGIGYFERHAEVEGDHTLNIFFKKTEMNDVLKSLTVLDDSDKGIISSISYESVKPISKQLEAISLSLSSGSSSLIELIGQMKGVPVEVSIGETTKKGQVIGTQRLLSGKDGASVQHLCLLEDGISLSTYSFQKISGIKILDETVKKDLKHLMSVLALSKKKDNKKLTIFCKGEGKRAITISYAIETPVWKTSYRLVLRNEGEDGLTQFIQGWAMVDNTSDEDWKEVNLSLVSGKPVSFIHDLYNPRYKRRDTVQVEGSDDILIESKGAPVDIYAARGLSSINARSRPPPVAPIPVQRGYYQQQIAHPGRSDMMNRAVVAPETRPAPSSIKVDTETSEVGNLFEYKIKNAVTVKRGQSALVPIFQGSFNGERVALYNPEKHEKYPKSAIYLKNSTGVTLESGPVTIFEAGTYMGEAMMPTLVPNEKTFVSFSVELSLSCSSGTEYKSTEVYASNLSGGVLRLNRYRQKVTTYCFTNKNPKPISVYVEHRFEKGSSWSIHSPSKYDQKTTNFWRFRVEIPAKVLHAKQEHFKVIEKTKDVQNYTVSSHLNRSSLDTWFKSDFIDESTHKELSTLIKVQDEINEQNRIKRELSHERSTIFTNQDRLRKNIASLGSRDSSKLHKRYLNQLEKEEDDLQAIDTKLKKATQQLTTLQSKITAAVANVRYAAEHATAP